MSRKKSKKGNKKIKKFVKQVQKHMTAVIAVVVIVAVFLSTVLLTDNIIPGDTCGFFGLAGDPHITLRPEANGYMNQWEIQYARSQRNPTNWNMIDETVPDYYETCIWTLDTPRKDYFEIQDPPPDMVSKTRKISHVTIYALCTGVEGVCGDSCDARIEFIIRDNPSGTERISDEQEVTHRDDNWGYYQASFKTDTAGHAWTWERIERLQIGIQSQIWTVPIWLYCTQLYAEVHYYGMPLNPPHADFVYSPLDPEVGETVVFNDRSTGDITGWEWDFCDGTIANGPYAKHTFTFPYIFAVTLTVVGPDGQDWITKYVTVTSPLQPSTPRS